MAHFLIQAKPTSEFWNQAMSDPDHFRGQWVKIAAERLGGQVQGLWLSFGEHDVVMICEMPDNISAAALSLAYSASGVVTSFKTTPLVSIEESAQVFRRASGRG